MKKYIYCDSCKDETEHILLKDDMYQCQECSTVTRYVPEKEIEIRAIISSGSTSEVGKLNIKESETLEVGDEVIVEVNEGFKIGEVTSLELKNGKRSQIAEVRDVETVWLRDVGEVDVKLSLHKGAVTTPYEIHTSGETEFRVGEVLNIHGRKFRITRMKLINGKLLKKNGATARAKEIKRIYAMYEAR
jgi:uncharacterized Zn finger protein